MASRVRIFSPEFFFFRQVDIKKVHLGLIKCRFRIYDRLNTMAKISPAQFVRQVRQEILRISWASRRETGLATITVFAMATIAAIFFLLVDAVLSNVIQFILGFGS